MDKKQKQEREKKKRNKMFYLPHDLLGWEFPLDCVSGKNMGEDKINKL